MSFSGGLKRPERGEDKDASYRDGVEVRHVVDDALARDGEEQQRRGRESSRIRAHYVNEREKRV